MNFSVIHLKDQFPNLCQEGQDPTLQVYIPDGIEALGRGDEKRPSVLVCPGGGYRVCSQREDEVIALQFASKGFHAFLLRYTCAPACFPTQIREVAAAMELIYRYADEWHCDTEKIAIIGFSAGGHLAAHYSTCYDCPEVREVFPDSKPVNASILCYPVISAKPGQCHEQSIRNVSGSAEITPEISEKFSLQNFVTDHTPPTFLWHTVEDSVVPVMNSLVYAQALEQHNVPFALHIYPYGSHGLSTVDDLTHNQPLDDRTSLCKNWLTMAIDWLRVY